MVILAELIALSEKQGHDPNKVDLPAAPSSIEGTSCNAPVKASDYLRASMARLGILACYYSSFEALAALLLYQHVS